MSDHRSCWANPNDQKMDANVLSHNSEAPCSRHLKLADTCLVVLLQTLDIQSILWLSPWTLARHPSLRLYAFQISPPLRDICLAYPAMHKILNSRYKEDRRDVDPREPCRRFGTRGLLNQPIVAQVKIDLLPKNISKYPLQE